MTEFPNTIWRKRGKKREKRRRREGEEKGGGERERRIRDKIRVVNDCQSAHSTE